MPSSPSNRDRAHAIVKMWLDSDDEIPAQEQRDRLVEDIANAMDSAATQALFEANSKLVDEGNEGMKRQRLEAAISKLSARYPTKDEAEYLREVIAEAQG